MVIFVLFCRRHRYQDHAISPLYGRHLEKSSHVLLCPDHKAKKILENKLHGPIRILSHWRAGRRIKRSEFIRSDGIRDAVRDQEKIGLTNFVLGRWSPKWQIIQSKHYKWIYSKKLPRRWATTIIRRLFLVPWDMWQYLLTIDSTERPGQKHEPGTSGITRELKKR